MNFDEKIDIISITFDLEIHLQILQILSIDIHFDKRSINNYYIIINSEKNYTYLVSYLCDLCDLCDISKDLYNKIIFIDANNILPSTASFHKSRPDLDLSYLSYLKQEILKLSIAKFVNTKYYLMLDSKNHFIRDVDITDFKQDIYIYIHVFLRLLKA